MEEALQVEEVGQDSQVTEAEEVEEGELVPQALEQWVEAQMGMPVQHGQRRDPQVQLQTGKAGRRTFITLLHQKYKW